MISEDGNKNIEDIDKTNDRERRRLSPLKLQCRRREK